MSAEESEGKKKKSPMIMILAVLVVLLGAGGAAGAYFVLGKQGGGGAAGAESGHGEPAAEGHGGEAAAAGEGAHSSGGSGSGVSAKMEPYIVNLNESDANRYLKVVMELEVSDESVSKELDARSAQIRDVCVTILSSKSFGEVQNTEGKTLLKDELIAALNNVLSSGKVLRIYFTQFVVQ